jgi:uncharacterized membrane protein YoaK (UPF0700 family)
MGIQNAVARRLAVPDLTTTVLTMTLTGLAADLPTATRRSALLRRCLAIAAILIGAFTGAEVVVNASAAAALALALGLLVAVAVAATIVARTSGRWRH